jgi:hypothetical protein
MNKYRKKDWVSERRKYRNKKRKKREVQTNDRKKIGRKLTKTKTEKGRTQTKREGEKNRLIVRRKEGCKQRSKTKRRRKKRIYVGNLISNFYINFQTGIKQVGNG